MPKNYCIMQIRAESGKSALPICNYSQILYQFLTFTQNLKRSPSQKSSVLNFFDWGQALFMGSSPNNPNVLRNKVVTTVSNTDTQFHSAADGFHVFAII